MKRIIVLIGMVFVFLACTGDFKEINTDKSGVTDEDLQADYNEHGIRLGIIQQGIYFNYDYGKGKNWPFQLTQNLNADMFSGYMHDAKPLNGGSHNSDYNLQDGWNSAMWGHTYEYVFPQIYQSENATRDRMPAFFGITKILKVEVMHRVTDYYGPIVYSHFADPEARYMPNTQKEVYSAFFCELDTAVAVLSDYIVEHPGASEFARFDMLLDGDYDSWIKFANSLRLRLAMRIASVAPDKARAEIQKIKENLKKKLSSKRYEHTIGVEYTSTCLAMRYGVDIEKARIAGLLHDCAKYLSSEDKISKCESYGIPVSDYERKNPELLHAKLGACFANEIYGVTDSEILSAIIWHTTGCPDMSLLDKIVFIADYIEANRDKAEDLPKVRELAFKDIDACLLLILEDTIAYLARKKSVTDPMTQKTYDYYKERN